VAFLEVRTGPNAGQRCQLLTDCAVVGRYPFCDLVLQAKTISRQHARITRIDQAYYIEDLESINGTFLNGQKVESQASLKDLDRINLYDTLLIFHNSQTAGTVPPPPAPEDSPTLGETVEYHPPVALAVDVTTVQPAFVGAEARLAAVLRIARDLGGSLVLEEVLPKLLDSLFAIFPQAKRGHILLTTDVPGELVPSAIKQGRHDSDNAATFRPISRALATRVIEQGEAVLVTDGASDQQFKDQGAVLEFESPSLMCAPLMGPSHTPVGVIHVETDEPKQPFGREDLEVLVSVAIAAGQAVELVRMHEASLKLKLRERELATAKEVQLRLLPPRSPQIEGYEFFDHYHAADEVGGDYLGYVPLPDGRLAIALGDVAGKGVSAALMMAQLSSEVRYCIATSATPAEVVERLNRDLATLEERLVTFVLCVLDPREHTMTLVNAGHLSPLRRRNSGRVLDELCVDMGGPPLGVVPDMKYNQVEVALEPGDVVTLYTDGITDATDLKQNFYGLQRVRHVLVRGPATPAELGKFLLDDVARFTAGAPQRDDIGLICFGRNAG
jgi:serine phosphatase RsbU (regulator of sigma subunit)